MFPDVKVQDVVVGNVKPPKGKISKNQAWAQRRVGVADADRPPLHQQCPWIPSPAPLLMREQGGSLIQPLIK